MVSFRNIDNVDCCIQNICRSFGEPDMFITSILIDDVKKIMNNITTSLNNLDKQPYLDDYRFNAGEMYAVRSNDHTWHRGIYTETNDDASYQFITCDNGKSFGVTPAAIKKIPEKLKNLPRLSVACKFIECFEDVSEIWKNYIKVNENLRLSLLHDMPYRENEFVAVLKSNDGNKPLGIIHITDWLPLKPPNYTLQSTLNTIVIPKTCDVIITTFCTSNYVYVRPILNNVQEDFSLLQQDLHYHCLTVQKLNYIPIVGSIVGIKSKIDGNFYRALVSSIYSKDEVIVTLIDYGNRELVTADQFYPLTEKLIKKPCFAALVRMHKVKDKELNWHSLRCYRTLVQDEVVLHLEMINPELDEINVVLTHGTSCASINQFINYTMENSMKACEKLESSWISYDEEKFRIIKVKYPDLNLTNIIHRPFIMHTELPVGQILQFILLNWHKNNGITFCIQSDPLLRYIDVNLTERITEYAVNDGEQSYVPKESEVCVAKYDKDGCWYRALAIENKDNLCQLVFSDFGNTEFVDHNNIRKCLIEYTRFPTLCHYGIIAGLEEDEIANEEINKRIKNLLKEKCTFEGIILEHYPEHLKSTVFIPELFTTLIEENLIPKEKDEIMCKTLEKYMKNKTSFETENNVAIHDAATKYNNFAVYKCLDSGAKNNFFKLSESRNLFKKMKKLTFNNDTTESNELNGKLNSTDLISDSTDAWLKKEAKDLQILNDVDSLSFNDLSLSESQINIEKSNDVEEGTSTNEEKVGEEPVSGDDKAESIC